ncbi:MAG: cellulase family glycosylhydrolase [Lachnospiraceae bacterium]|nr:cellulase family glycosylhydrolase [Lachnospiraceae bacterium]
MKKFEGFQKGINLGGWLSQCVSYDREHFNGFITKEDIDRIASFGLDHIRLPIDYDVFMNESDKGDAPNEEGLSHIDDFIGWCNDLGLNMVLDLHKAKGYMFDTQAVSDPDRFFKDDDLQETFYETWEMFAKRYFSERDLTFELLNEVVNGDFQKKWNEIATNAIKRIRSIDSDRKIIVGGVHYNNVFAVSGIDVPVDDNIVFNFHCYEPLCFTHQKAYWVEGMTKDYEMFYPADVETMRRKSEEFSPDHMGAVFDPRLDNGGPLFDTIFKPACEHAEKNNVSLYCGEYGVIDQAPLPDTLAWVKDIHASFEKYGIGRALWNYKNKDFGLVDEHYAPIRSELIKVL